MSVAVLDRLKPGLVDYVGKVVLPHWRIHWANWLSVIAAVLTFNHCFTLTFNVSESLPQSVFLVLKGDKADLGVGEYVAFSWAGGGPFVRGTGLLKQIGGVAGDQVTAIGRAFFVNGEFVGTAKVRSKKGMPLEVGPVGRIPADHFYMRAPHRDSLDSRYALTGWVPLDRVIGRAIPLI